MLILMDGAQNSEKLLDFSMRLFNPVANRINATLIHRLRNNNKDNLFEHAEPSIPSNYSYAAILDKILHSETDNSNEFIQRFIEKCQALNIRTQLYLNKENFERGFPEDSMYSDLLVIGKSILLENKDDTGGSQLMENMLRSAKCPVLITPNEWVGFKNVVLLFDGTTQSFEAIKLFVYLVSDQLHLNRLTVFTVVNDQSIEMEKNLCNYLKMHEPFFSIYRIYPDNYYSEMLSMLTDMNEFLLVTGVNRDQIIEDLIFNRQHSFFLNGNRSVFMY